MGTPEEMKEWLGRSRVDRDLLTITPPRGMLALLDRDPRGLDEGSRLPPGWHWLFFRPLVRRSELGPDGHPKRGGFLPPVSLPRRMWAGGRLRFSGPLRLGQRVERRSEIVSIDEKEGRSGRLVFVTVRQELDGGNGTAVVEEQDLVYREPAAPDGGFGGPPPPGEASWSEEFSADAVTLFRFSALTFNAHRIHYDRPYATGVEDYPDLVVHGPLVALLLLDAGARRVGGTPTSFSYRAVSPLFRGESFELAGRGAGGGDGPGLWAAHPERGVAMTAEIETEP